MMINNFVCLFLDRLSISTLEIAILLKFKLKIFNNIKYVTFQIVYNYVSKQKGITGIMYEKLILLITNILEFISKEKVDRLYYMIA